MQVAVQVPASAGKSGIEVSEIFPEVGKCIDDICVIRSMHTDIPNHEPALLMMTCGNTQPIRPSMGSWLTYGLGTENQNLPGFVVLCPGKPVVGPAAVEQQLPARRLPGLPHQQLEPRPEAASSSTSATRNVAAGTQREQLDLLNAAQRRCTWRSGGGDDQLEARIQSLEMAFRMQTEAQEAFDVEPRDRRSVARQLRQGLLRRRLPRRPGGWSSAACAWCRSTTATASRGTTTATSTRATATRRRTRPADRRAAHAT